MFSGSHGTCSFDVFVGVQETLIIDSVAGFCFNKS